MLATAVLFGLVLASAITDLARQRIYNATTYSGMAAALVLSITGWLIEALAPQRASAWQSWVGWIDVSDCLLGWFACGFMMLLCFVFFSTGGGDVKLLAMIGAFLGLERGLEVLLWTFIFGGCVGLSVLAWRMGLRWMLVRVASILLPALGIKSWNVAVVDDRQTMRSPVYLGPCAAAALLTVMIWPVRVI